MLGTEFSITTKTNISMSVYDNASSCSISIRCISSSRMILTSVQRVVISSLSFINCGGSIATFVDSFTLKDSNFIMDPQSYIYSSYTGRAWTVFGSETLTIDSCTFISNAASRRGGALYISAVTNTIIALCAFINNTAAAGREQMQGGAVYINAAINSIINGSTFLNNTLQGGEAQEGGAVYVSATNSTIYRSTFTNNTASGSNAKGGALYVNATNSVINGAMFRSNKASGDGAEGGALYVTATNSVIGMSTFINNTVTHGAPSSWYINAKTSIIHDHDVTYEEIEWQDQNFNTTFNDGICSEYKDSSCIVIKVISDTYKTL